MDLGIRGKRALVCASSKGLGCGSAEALAEAGVDLVMNARGVEVLEAAAAEIRAKFGVKVAAVAGDITTQAGRAAVLAQGPFDILVTNAGGPPPGLWSDWSREDFIKALDANMLTPIALMQAVLPGMMAKGWGPGGQHHLVFGQGPDCRPWPVQYCAGGTDGFRRGNLTASRRKGVIINNLLPGIHATDRSIALDAAVVKARGISLEEVIAERAASIPVGRYGTAAEFGATCAFLCSQHAGFMVGQNIVLDGGAINATM